MPLSEIDRKLIDRCLGREPGAWNDFVDRYLGLIYHVIQHVAHARSRVVSQADMEDIAAEILLRVVDDDYDVLRRYKATSSLPTYLTVIARRVCVKEMIKRQREAELGHASAHRLNVNDTSDEVESIATAEEVERMLGASRARGRSCPSLSPQVHELSRDRQAAWHSRGFRRADSVEGQETAQEHGGTPYRDVSSAAGRRFVVGSALQETPRRRRQVCRGFHARPRGPGNRSAHDVQVDDRQQHHAGGSCLNRGAAG